MTQENEEQHHVTSTPPYRQHVKPPKPWNEKKADQETVVYEYDDDETAEEDRCGLPCFKPDFLQPLRNMKVFLLVFILAGVSQSMFRSIWNMTISTIEKRFQIPSKTIGGIAAMNDVSHVCVVLFVAHFCGRSHRPRWLFVGLFTVGVAVLSFASPELFAPKWDMDNVVLGSNKSGTFDKEMCLTSEQAEKIKQQCVIDAPMEVNKNLLTFALLGLAQILLGIGTTAPVVLAMPFIDDNVKTKNSPIYFALGSVGRFIGPMLGVFLGSACLSTYIDLTKTPNIDQADPRWMGAWYLGFLIVGTLICCMSTLYLWFPARVPATQKVKIGNNAASVALSLRATRPLVVKSNSKEPSPPLKNRPTNASVKEHFAALPRDLMRLLVNRVYVCRVMNDCIDMLVVSGYSSFAPKYLEYHFRMSPAKAGKFNGVAGICAIFGGHAIGGMLIKKLKMQPGHVALMICFSSFMISICFFFLMLVTCQQRNLFSQPGPDQMLLVNSSCANGCNCAGRSFSPVCDESTGISYYSPCHAGCTQFNETKDGKYYGNCSCLAPKNWKYLDDLEAPAPAPAVWSRLENSTLYYGLASLSAGFDEDINVTGKTVKRGFCEGGCKAFWTYVIVSTCFKFIGAMPFSGNQMLSFRIVDPDLKSLGTAVRTLFASLFALIPGPIIMGAVIDSCCRLWNTQACGAKGACLLYDLDSLRVKMHLYVGAVKTIACLMDIYVYFKVRHWKFERDTLPSPPETEPTE